MEERKADLGQAFAFEEKSNLEVVELARKAVEAASEKQATDIVMLDLRNVSSFTDYFVLCSGQTVRQIDAIRQRVEEVLGKEGLAVHHAEGTPDSGWVLLDFGDILVHIFAPAERDYYQLDRVWDKATPLLRIQ